jgi:hypothetical protein
VDCLQVERLKVVGLDVDGLQLELMVVEHLKSVYLQVVDLKGVGLEVDRLKLELTAGCLKDVDRLKAGDSADC